MPIASLAPLDETITIAELTRDPYPIYQRLRRDAPLGRGGILGGARAGRTLAGQTAGRRGNRCR